MSPSPRRYRTASLATALTLAIALSLPADSATPAGPPTQIWIDVATHNMANMPDMGAMGRFAMKMAGADKARPSFPTTRHPGNAGYFVDVALYNRLKPGVTADVATPDGSGLGTLTLMPPPSGQTSHASEVAGAPPDVEITVREYWGCGATPGPGQPKVSTYRLDGGAMSISGGMTPGVFAPQRDVQPTPAYALWPNKVSGMPVPDGASLAGTHRFSGEGIPASLKFDLARSADFMPKIALTSQMGEDDDPINLSWQPVERAQAYFLTAAQMDAAIKPGAGKSMPNKVSMTVWSSAQAGGAGESLVDYLSASDISKWLKQKILLPTSTTTCTIPQGIFGNGNGLTMANMVMLQMAAYGPETTLSYPPKPTNPKLLASWKPEWSVRVRTKSTTNAVAGMNPDEDDKTRKESIGKKLFKNLLKGKL